MILAINCGSSTLKYTLFDFEKYEVVASGNVERIGTGGSFITHKSNGDKNKYELPLNSHEAAFYKLLELIEKDGINKEDIKVVAHRFVHGGEKYRKSQIVTEEALKDLEKLNPLAPLHNPANITGIKSAMAVMPWAKNTITLDTSFHETLPECTYMYGLPYEWYEKFGVRRYGFHGTSYLYTSRRLAKLLGKKPQELNAIICHLGSGASVCAIKNGVSVDTSLGFSPLEGLVMGTRPGDTDLGIISYMARNGVSLEEQEVIFSKKSGLLGLCGYNDMRDLEERADTDPKCKMANDVFNYRVAKYIASYFGILPSVDAVVFTAGAGERAQKNRADIIAALANLGIKMDMEANDKAFGGPEAKISAYDSSTAVYMIPTNEEIVLIEDAQALLDGKYKGPSEFYSYKFEE